MPPLRSEIQRLYRGAVRRTAPRTFPLFQRLGLHVVANDFNSPIPDTRTLDAAYGRATEHVGVDFREAEQLALLERFSEYKSEMSWPRSATADSRQYFLDNGRFEGVDARILWATIRDARPKRVVEVGSGMSTILAAAALRKNRDDGEPGELLAIEPYPAPFLDVPALEVVTLIQEPVEHVPLDTFESLGANDILFIDSTHILKAGGDVQYLFLEVLPRLAPGVLVHVHDIYLPWEYPRAFVTKTNSFWTEQYLLQAFLINNSRVEVVFSNCWMLGVHRAEIKASLGVGDDETACGSFWMRVLP